MFVSFSFGHAKEKPPNQATLFSIEVAAVRRLYSVPSLYSKELR